MQTNQQSVEILDHIKVYYQPGRFGGWPANHGMWAWGDELLVGFSRGYFKDLGPRRHAIDRERPEDHLLARSLDGGENWMIENPSEKGALLPKGSSLHGTELPGLPEPKWTDCPGGIDFTQPNFALTLRMTNVDVGPSRFYYSLDRGHNWRGPFRFPDLRGRGIAARTDYVVLDKHDCLVFLTAGKANREEGRPLCARTEDGGRTWRFVGWIGAEPEGFSIMPSTVRLDPETLLTTVRRREGPKRWIDAYVSHDLGMHWEYLSTPAPDVGIGNPPSMIQLRDGRLCVTYGFRRAPYGMRARLSENGGRSWSKEIVLRADGGGRDMGYPRTVERPDGTIVTVYYFHDEPLGDRYIAATLWRPS